MRLCKAAQSRAWLSGTYRGDRQTVSSPSHIKSRTGGGDVDGRLDWRGRSGSGVGGLSPESGLWLLLCCCRAAGQPVAGGTSGMGRSGGSSGEERGNCEEGGEEERAEL